jgi:hypothetical protein
MADNYGLPPVQGPEYELLGAFIGKWHAEGQSYGQNQDRKNPRAAAQLWVSDEVTEWHPGRFFVIQREDARTGSDALITHAVIGYDPQTGDYFAHAFENHGHHNRYVGRVDGGTWTFKGDSRTASCESQALAWCQPLTVLVIDVALSVGDRVESCGR